MKNKILPILCIFIWVSVVFIGNSFAYEATYNDKNFYLPDEIINVAKSLDEYSEVGSTLDLMICQDAWGNGSYLIFFFPINSSVYDTLRFPDSNGIRKEFQISVDELTFFRYDSNFLFVESYNHNMFSCTKASGTYYLYSTADIYTDNTCTDFFWTPPLPTTLAGVLAEANPTKTFQTMMSGTIPYLIAFLVGLVAFWKAWQLLLKELRKA